MSNEPVDHRRLYAQSLLRDLAKFGWKLTVTDRGRARLEPVGKTAKKLPFELRYWLSREYRREVLMLVHENRGG
jgi:hypothetical protein